MINIEKTDAGLYIVSDMEYTPNRYSVILHFLEKQRLDVLDYQITLAKQIAGFDVAGFNIYPTALDESFEDILKGLNEIDEDDDDGDSGDVNLKLTILCQSRPFDLISLSDLTRVDDELELLEEIRHYLVSTDNLVCCDDESILNEYDMFWKLEHTDLIEKIDNRIKEIE